ncbi:MAG TPA: type IV secretion system protein [Rhodanobacteraceae bacterium]
MPKVKLTPPSGLGVREQDLDVRKLMRAVVLRLSGVAIAAGLAIAALAFTFMLIMPLKRSVPYVVHVDNQTGQVSVPTTQVVQRFRPQWINKAYFLRNWIVDLLTINQYTTVAIDDPAAQAFLRGSNAISEYNSFRASDNTFVRLAKNPALVRTVNIQSLEPVAGTKNMAVAQVQTTTHTHGHVRVTNRLITISYVFINSTDPATLHQNPIGIYITDFQISKQS